MRYMTASRKDRVAAATALLVAMALAPAVQAQQPAPPPLGTPADPMNVQPAGPPPSWAPAIDAQMLVVIEQLQRFEPVPLPQLTAFQARNAKGPAEAAMAVLHRTGMSPVQPKVSIAHRVLPVGGPEGTLVRTYTPMQGSAPFPVIVYYHGGGWVIADLDTYEPSAKALAEKTGAVVVSVAYRQAPENKFPAAHEDAFAAYSWVVENASGIGGDPVRIATAGESAGGNLAVAVALMARDRDVRLPVHILSVYPIADGDTQSASYDEYADAMPLNRAGMAWFFDNYLRTPADGETPWISLVDADLSGLPATTIINAQIDPLQAEGETLAQRMSAAGVQVEQRTFAGVTHEFFGMAALLEQAVQAQEMAVMRLKQSFGR
jgi:acetyl esterase